MQQPVLKTSRNLVVLALSGLVLGAGSASADPAEVFRGERVTLAVPFGEGGGFDRVGRAFIQHFEKLTGATAIVRNETGAGGLLSVNQGAIADPETFRIQMVNTVGAVASTLGNAPGVQFDLGDFGWIGSLSTEPDAVLVSPSGRFQTIEALLNHDDAEKPVRFAASGPGDNLFINPLVVGNVFDFPYEIISGYSGGPEAWLGVLRGEADAVIWAFSAALRPTTAGDGMILAFLGDRPASYHAGRALPEAFSAIDLDAVPTLHEVATARNLAQPSMAVLEAHLDARDGGRALATAPGTDPERLAAYRAMFDKVINDEEFLDAFDSQGLFLNPMLGEDLEAHIQSVLDSPDAYKQIILESYNQ